MITLGDKLSGSKRLVISEMGIFITRRLLPDSLSPSVILWMGKADDVQSTYDLLSGWLYQ